MRHVPTEAINDLLRFQYFMKNYTTTVVETQGMNIMAFADSPEVNCYASLLSNMLIRTNYRG